MVINNSTVSQSAKRISLWNRVTYYYAKYGSRGQGLNDPTLPWAMQAWDEEAATKELVRQCSKQIADFEHYCRMMERTPWDSHEVARDGVITSTVIPSTRRFQALVPYPAPIEPATTLSDCCPEDLPSA